MMMMMMMNKKSIEHLNFSLGIFNKRFDSKKNEPHCNSNKSQPVMEVSGSPPPLQRTVQYMQEDPVRLHCCEPSAHRKSSSLLCNTQCSSSSSS
jgi:hypothetical protein